jgi:DNA polymerase III sliding clamp (beta) subunit (PCNA family)
MTQTLNRETLLNQLESIRPGLSAREVIQQSSCFVFQDGKVMTYNDEVACIQKTDLKITGAVQADPLVAVLAKLPSEFVEIDVTDSELVIRSGKSRSSGIRMESEILLPVDAVEAPEKWAKLPVDFTDAVYIVSQCVGKDESEFVLTCVHLTPTFIEACDNFQLSRYPLDFKLKQACLVKADSIGHIVDFDMTEYSETQTWLHFRNPTGLILSCRKTIDEYPSLDKLLDVSGSPATLPKGLAEATANANIFTAENADNDSVLIQLSSKNGGMLRVEGDGASGWYKEVKRLKYDGESLKFRIAPKLLIELTKRHNQCEITPDRLMVDGGKFRYVTCLGTADE